MMFPDRFVYTSILPKVPATFPEEWFQCFNNLSGFSTDIEAALFKLTIFLDSEDKSEFDERRQFISQYLRNHFQEKCPTFCVLPQPPEKPFKIAIEAGFVYLEDENIHYKKFEGLPYIVLKINELKELWVSGITQEYCPLDEASDNAFSMLRNLLSQEHMSFDHIVRQWNYIGCILQTLSTEKSLIQNYQIFNDIRHIHYQKYRQIKGFPAATGIGKKYEGVVIDCCALHTGSFQNIYSIESPVQRNPYEYDQDLLVGTPMADPRAKHAPEFERAKLVAAEELKHLFISGTASISGQHTVDIGNIGQQTIQTIRNIDTLTGIQNLSDHCPGIKLSDSSLRYIRAYVKDSDHFGEVKELCRKHYGNIPVTLVQADICRDELLVELEGEMNFC